MDKINLLITDANDNLSKQKEMIERAVSDAGKHSFPKLKIDWNINVLVTNRMSEMVIPEDGVSGNTYTSDFIIMSIDETKVTEFKLYEMLCHELCHAARWGKNDEWCNHLFDLLIMEGLATYYESTVVSGKEKEATFFMNTILKRSDEENEKILFELKDQLDDTKYDGRKILVQKTDTLPRWSGYSLGYYLVKKYLNHTGKKIEDVFADNYTDFRAALNY